jgi:hypothetical protein
MVGRLAGGAWSAPIAGLIGGGCGEGLLDGRRLFSVGKTRG